MGDMAAKRDATPWVPILGYHRVVEEIPADDYCGLCVTRRRFQAQMRWFARLGYRTLSLEEVAGYVARGERVPPRRFVVTFDDGYTDNLTVAAPILRAHGFSATVFVVSGLIGERNTWDEGHAAVAPLMTWDALKQWTHLGFSIGSHTVTHAHLSALSADAARREMVESRQTLEAGLDMPIRTFCYPYGDWSDEVVALVPEAGYAIACNNTGRTEHGRYIMARTDPRPWPAPLTPLVRCQPWYFEAYRRGLMERPKQVMRAWRRSSTDLRHALSASRVAGRA